jgi:hypothetical protein
MIYQHIGRRRDQVIATALDKLTEAKRKRHRAESDDQVGEERENNEE